MRLWTQCLKYAPLLFFWFISSAYTTATEVPKFNKFTVDLESFPKDMKMVDLNEDGLKDIFIVTRSSFIIFWQKESGGFSKDPDQILKFGQGLKAVDIGEVDFADGKEIICIGHQGVFYYRHQKNGNFLNDPQPLIEKPLSFPSTASYPSIVNFTRDLNSDGLDEILVPTEKGMMLFWQYCPGEFVRDEHFPVKKATYASAHTSFWPSSLSKTTQKEKGLVLAPEVCNREDYQFQDVNNDGFFDILVPNEKNLGFDVFLQTSDKKFLHSTKYSRMYTQALSPKGKTLLLDINKDGIIDWINLKVRGPLEESSLIVPTIQIAAFINKKSEDFENMSRYVFRSIYLSDFVPIVDIDQDGSQDIFTIYADLGLASKENIIRFLSKGKVDLLLRCYLFNSKKQGYSYTSDLAYPFVLECGDLADISQSIFVDFTGDFDGNGTHDFCFRKKAGTLSIVLLRRNRQKLSVLNEFEVQIPADTTLIKILDINRDGKADFLTLNESGTELTIFRNQNL